MNLNNIILVVMIWKIAKKIKMIKMIKINANVAIRILIMKMILVVYYSFNKL